MHPGGTGSCKAQFSASPWLFYSAAAAKSSLIAHGTGHCGISSLPCTKRGFRKQVKSAYWIYNGFCHIFQCKRPPCLGWAGEWGKGFLFPVLSWTWEKNSTKYNLPSSIGHLFLLDKLQCNEENQSLLVEMWGSSQKYFWGSYKYMGFTYFIPEGLSNTSIVLFSRNR